MILSIFAKIPLIFPLVLIISGLRVWYKRYFLLPKPKKLTPKDFQVDPSQIDPNIPFPPRNEAKHSFDELREKLKEITKLSDWEMPEKPFIQELHELHEEIKNPNKDEDRKYKIREGGEEFLEKWKAKHKKS